MGPWHLLGYVLRLLRHEHGESLETVADYLSVSFQSVSSWEHARVRMNVKYCRKLDARWNTGGLLELLHTAAKQGQKPHQFGEFARFERVATEIRVFGALWVPGLIQTREYARAAALSWGELDIDRLLEQRRERQELLARTPPPQLWIILDEGVLDRPVGGPKTMREQIARLIELGEIPHVTLRIVPKSIGGYRGLDGAFHLMSTGGRSVAYVEAPGGGFLVQSGAQVEEFMNRWDAISSCALTWDASKDLLLEAMEGYI